MAQPQSDHPAKILSVVWYKVLPAKFGGQKAVALFNKHLGLQAPLVCLCSKNNEIVDASYRIKAKLPVGKSQFLNPLVWTSIYHCIKREKVTHLILEFPYHGIAAFICKKMLRIKMIVNSHNIEFLRFKEQGKWWWRLLYQYEKWTMERADLLFFKSVADQYAAVKFFGLAMSKVAIVPYGAEKKNFSAKMYYKAVIHEKHNIEDDEKILLFAGTLDYAPNAQAVMLMNERLIPILNKQLSSYRIIICGRNNLKDYQHLNQLKNNRIVFAGEVENIDIYFNAADIFINPVISGGGVQTKIMDALCYHLNVVCFEEKKLGISGADNKVFAVESGNWTAFVHAVMKALSLKEPTDNAFFDVYNWNTIAALAYQKIISC